MTFVSKNSHSQPRQPDGAADRHDLVDLVHVHLVERRLVGRREARGDAARQLGLPDVRARRRRTRRSARWPARAASGRRPSPATRRPRARGRRRPARASCGSSHPRAAGRRAGPGGRRDGQQDERQRHHERRLVDVRLHLLVGARLLPQNVMNMRRNVKMAVRKAVDEADDPDHVVAAARRRRRGSRPWPRSRRTGRRRSGRRRR